ncbi:unnamed protein product [Schistosoma mattheei]|uniref:Uncharacterized protein n=1 Tax=Schistosoma mattheei TaxID=31246 RepID=A0A3P8GW18_9TREM|nr:unnamed protein product [Schistosoma mattheei]
MKELVLPDGFDPMSPSFTVRDVTTRLSGPRPISCRTEMYSQLSRKIRFSTHWDIANILIIIIRSNSIIIKIY